MLGVTNLYPAPQQLQGFSADEIFGADPQEIAEAVMGLDGILSAGYVFVPIRQHITLQADSASNDVFDNWVAAQQAQKDVYFGNAIITLPSLQKKWTMTNGVLATFPPIPDAARTLRPRRYSIVWQVASPAPA
jgi:hypothetical protein